MEFLDDNDGLLFGHPICGIVEQCFVSDQSSMNYYNHYNPRMLNEDFSTDTTTTTTLNNNSPTPIYAAGANADDATWILTSSFVIFTMQTGFALLETGCSSRGYEVNILMKNVVDVLFGAVSYYVVGYALSFGSPSNWFIGYGDFAPHSFVANEIFGTTFNDTGTKSGALFSRYIFQLSFAATSTTIVSGCVAMRIKFFVYCAFAFYAIIPYSICAHWFFSGNGWLKQMGVQDFAGGGPVHLLGATNGLMAILLLGPRTGRFDPNRNPRDFDAVSPTDSLFGLFMLWWGWIGFNCGSSFGITEDRWILATRAAITTINASAAGGISGIFYSLLHSSGREVRVDDVVNSILGGLVAITPACASVRSYDAFFFGAGGALSALLLNRLMFNLKIDDPVGAIGVHGGAAIWGLLSDGFFSDSKLPASTFRDGIFYGGDWHLLKVQCIAILAVFAWSFCTIVPFFYIIGVAVNGWNWKDPRTGLRISPREEQTGADSHLHGLKNNDNETSIGVIQHNNDDNQKKNEYDDDNDNYDNDDDDDYDDFDVNYTNNNNNNRQGQFESNRHLRQQQQHEDDSITADQDGSLSELPFECNNNIDNNNNNNGNSSKLIRRVHYADDVEMNLPKHYYYSNNNDDDDVISFHSADGFEISKNGTIVSPVPTMVISTPPALTDKTIQKLNDKKKRIIAKQSKRNEKAKNNKSKTKSNNIVANSSCASPTSSTAASSNNTTFVGRKHTTTPTTDLAKQLANDLSHEQIATILAILYKTQQQQVGSPPQVTQQSQSHFFSFNNDTDDDGIIWS